MVFRTRLLCSRRIKWSLTVLFKSAVFILAVNTVLLFLHDQRPDWEQSGDYSPDTVVRYIQTVNTSRTKEGVNNSFHQKLIWAEEEDGDGVPGKVPAAGGGYQAKVLYKKFVAPGAGVVQERPNAIQQQQQQQQQQEVAAPKDDETGQGGVLFKYADKPVQPDQPAKTVPKHPPWKPAVPDCIPLGYSKSPLPVTALASFPGSGNTWLRHLIQQASGYYTGSLYKDNSLAKRGYPGEVRADDSVVMVKTHEWPEVNLGVLKKPFQRAVLLVREPLAAIRAEFNRRSGGHAGHVKDAKFSQDKWMQAVNDLGDAWLTFNEKWLKFDGPIYVVRYEDLQSHTKETLAGLCSFLGIQVSDEVLQCIKNNSEGAYHRAYKDQPKLTVKENARFLLEVLNRTLFTDIQLNCPNCKLVKH